MDLTDVPEEVCGTGEEPLEFKTWESPVDVLKGGSIKERLLDVILQLRDPTKVSTIANRIDCDTETARDYL